MTVNRMLLNVLVFSLMLLSASLSLSLNSPKRPILIALLPFSVFLSSSSSNECVSLHCFFLLFRCEFHRDASRHTILDLCFLL